MKSTMLEIPSLKIVVNGYEISDEMQKRLDNDFTYHSPVRDQVDRYPMIRDEAKELAVTIVKLTPPSREQSVALTKLEEAVFWANAAIARNE
jgi:hypothetical protein